MTKSVDFTRHFLMAMPGLVDENFAGTVIYVCEHSERGALGLVINRPTDLTVARLLEKIELESTNPAVAEIPVYFGGPVQPDRGFVLHKPVANYSSSIHLSDDIALTTSKDSLQDIANAEGPDQIFVTLGYTGWGAGQLEQEMAQNAWLSVFADEDIIFETEPEARYPAAMRLLGIDPLMLAGSAGHA